ncbi:MerR family transcriptional regulator [Streptomyces sp. GSL17-111]|uniref:MerR family transcriptional regulator n=1 Tax=Streptomyces sp. GSL17-111 TaxID=3121596 RepID=UPI0030F42D91
MRIGELAARTGLTKDTVRFYEKTGLVSSSRLPNGYRDFPPEAETWLHYVRTAQSLGFSLAEIARTGEELRDAPDEAEALSALLEEKIHLIDARVAELNALRAELATRVGTGCPLRARERQERTGRAGRPEPTPVVGPAARGTVRAGR